MLIRKLILGFFVVGLAVWARTVLAAPGVDCAWPNNTTGAWTDAETWSCGTVPGIEDAVTVGLGAVITLDTAEAVDSLTLSGGTISGSGSLSVSGAVYVVDNLVDVTISTAGSYFPSLLLSPLQGIVSITDPTLQSGSLADVTVSQPIGSNAAIVLDIGAHPIAALTMNSGNLGWIGEVTVTNSLLWSNGSLGGGAALTMTVGAGATFTISEGGHSVYAPRG